MTLVMMWRKENFKYCWWQCKLVQTLQKAVWILQKLKLELPSDTVIALQLLSMNIKTQILKDVCKFTEGLLQMAKFWENESAQ